MYLGRKSGHREDGPVLRSAHGHVGIVASLRRRQPEARGVDHALCVQDHQAGPAPRQDEIRPDVGRRHYRAARGANPAHANGYVNRGAEAVVILLRAARAGVFGQEAIEQGLPARLPAAVPGSVDKLQVVQVMEYLRDTGLSRKCSRSGFLVLTAAEVHERADDGRRAHRGALQPHVRELVPAAVGTVVPGSRW